MLLPALLLIPVVVLLLLDTVPTGTELEEETELDGEEEGEFDDVVVPGGR